LKSFEKQGFVKTAIESARTDPDWRDGLNTAITELSQISSETKNSLLPIKREVERFPAIEIIEFKGKL